MLNIKSAKPLPVEFYERDTLVVSRELLGKILIRITMGRILSAKIVETEAYIGDHDPASHSFNKYTERNKVMYDRGGKAYVYFIYGNYYCFNVVTGKKGEGNAVLIRAAEPVTEIDIMKKLRGKTRSIYELSNGPAKLCMAMNIERKIYGADLTKKGEVYISGNEEDMNPEILCSRRIGLSAGEEYFYRFFIKDNPYVTKHKFNKEVKIHK